VSAGLPHNQATTIIDGFPREWFAAEVLNVDFEGQNKNTLYTVDCRILGAYGQNRKDVVRARALDANIKNIPIAGEIIMVTKAPSPYGSAANISLEYYYTNPISVQSSIHHNGIPGLTHYVDSNQPENSNKRNQALDGITPTTSKRFENPYTIDPIFVERTDVHPIQPYSGDIIFEGRWGQSIRFGSTIDERRIYPQRPTWKKGLGATGNPILIISNGTNPDSPTAKEFILESIDNDDAAIWMTSGQYVKFEQASTFTPSISDKSIDLFTKNEYGGNAVIIASDRIVFNAKKQEIIGFSKEGIGFTSEKGISLDGKQVVEFESEEKISLGLNAVEPVLLGRRTMDWLNNLCEILVNVTNAIAAQTHPTGTGPSGVPINMADFVTANADIKSIQGEINKLASQLVFVCEKSGGPNEEDKAKAQEGMRPSAFAQEGDIPHRLEMTQEDFLENEDIYTMVADASEVEKEKIKMIDSILEEADPEFDYGAGVGQDEFGNEGGPA
jgi:hypothetical protein